MSLSRGVDNDSEELAKFGYKQDLKRSMRKFSSFAVSFSLISILTGIFANFHFGFSEVGNFISISLVNCLYRTIYCSAYNGRVIDKLSHFRVRVSVDL